MALVENQRLNIKRVFNSVPAEIINNADLNAAIRLLPEIYNFEIHKSIWRIKKEKAKRVALQFPEGLLIFSLIISDILEKFCGVDTFVLGDITYGACCIDGFTAKALRCDFLIHYGHSCLVPIAVAKMPVLYVYVKVEINKAHFLKTLVSSLPKEAKIAIAGTIQFVHCVYEMIPELKNYFASVYVPKENPLSHGEVLGCTAPKLSPDEVDHVVFVADGRFHMESLMIQNPNIKNYFKYDPYNKKLIQEFFDFKNMMSNRKNVISKSKSAKIWGVVFSTLGRQGNPKILERIEQLLQTNQKNYYVLLLSEILPDKLNKIKDCIDCWVQIGCPRLSIDWGDSFETPLLTPFEAYVALGKTKLMENSYPMDFYSKDGDIWSNYYNKRKANKNHKAIQKTE